MVWRLPKNLLVVLLAVFLTAGFNLSTAHASIIPTKMTMLADRGLALSGTGKTADATTMKVHSKSCVKQTGDSDNPTRCPPTCITPVLGLLPQDLAVARVGRALRPPGLSGRSLRGRRPLPDPFPPRSPDAAQPSLG